MHSQKRGYTPLYYGIAEELRKKILCGQLSASSRLPNEEDMRAQYGVSRVTIRGALKKLESEGLIRRINGKGTFVAEQSLRKSKRLLLVTDDSPAQMPHLHKLMMGAVIRAQELDFEVQVCPGVKLRAQLRRAIEMPTHRIGLLFLRCRNLNENDLSYAEKNGVVSVVDAGRPLSGCNSLAVDNAAAMYELVDHLFGLGRCRFGIFTASSAFPWSSFEERCGAAMSHLKHLGISERQIRVVTLDEKKDIRTDAYTMTAAFFRKSSTPIDALICVNDLIAVQAMRWMTEHGIRIPDEVAVTGFDDVDLAQYSTPPLTTVRQDYFQSGAHAVNVLDGLMEAFDNRRIRQVRKLDLIVRQSTVGICP